MMLARRIAAKLKTTWRIRRYGRDIVSLIKMLEDEDSEVRLEAIMKLTREPDKLAFESLVTCLNDKQTIFKAIVALAVLKDMRVIEPFVNLLQISDDSRVRQSVAFQLGTLGDKRAIEPLWYVFTSDQNQFVQSTALHSLARLGDKRVIEPLWNIFNTNQDQSTRMQALNSLGSVGDKQAFEPLVAALNDKDLGWSAIQGLWALGDERAIKPLMNVFKLVEHLEDCDYKMLDDLGMALASFGETALLALIEALDSQDWITRWGAALSLGYFDDDRAIEALGKVLASNEAAQEAIDRIDKSRSQKLNQTHKSAT